MALTDKDKKQLTAFAAFVALAGAAAFIYWIHLPSAQQITQTARTIDSLQVQVDSARRDLARGSVENLRQRVEAYQQSVRLMRRLVPTASEVPNLIDGVSSRARVRGVNVAQFTPLDVEPGAPFQTHKYRFSVIGHYDQIGEFLSDVGSLPRIMVPYDVNVAVLQNSPANKSFTDSTGAVLEASFRLRTFVKAAADTSAGGTE